MSFELAMLCGYWSLKKLTPGRSAIIEFFLCIKAALGNLSGGGKYWIDNASHAYTDIFLDEMREVLLVLVLFIPLPVFWALFEQSGSRWVYQATRMIAPLNTKANWFIEPDQMQTIIPVMILIVLPIFEYLFYPRLRKLKFVLSTPRQRVMFGAFLAVVAFVMAGFVQLEIEPTLTQRPHAGQGSLLLWNVLGACTAGYNLSIPSLDEPVIVDPLSARLLRNLPVDGVLPFDYSFFNLPDTCGEEKQFTKPHESSALVESKVISIFNTFMSVQVSFPEMFADDLIYSHTDRCDLQLPRVGNTYLLSGDRNKKEVRWERGEVSVIMVKWNPGVSLNHTTLVPPLNISMYWQVPQYLTLSIAEFLFPMALLEYAHSQVSIRMKPVITSFYLLTIAQGNLLVALLSFCNLFYREAYQYLLYTILMLVDCLLLLVLLFQYKPTNVERSPPPLDRDESVESVRSAVSNMSDMTQRSTRSTRSTTNGRCVVM